MVPVWTTSDKQVLVMPLSLPASTAYDVVWKFRIRRCLEISGLSRKFFSIPKTRGGHWFMCCRQSVCGWFLDDTIDYGG